MSAIAEAKNPVHTIGMAYDGRRLTIKPSLQVIVNLDIVPPTTNHIVKHVLKHKYPNLVQYSIESAPWNRRLVSGRLNEFYQFKLTFELTLTDGLQRTQISLENESTECRDIYDAIASYRNAALTYTLPQLERLLVALGGSPEDHKQVILLFNEYALGND